MHLAATFRIVAADIYTVVMMSYQFSNHGSYLDMKHFSFFNFTTEKLRKSNPKCKCNLSLPKITVNRVTIVTTPNSQSRYKSTIARRGRSAYNTID